MHQRSWIWAALGVAIACFGAPEARAVEVYKDEAGHRSLSVGVLVQPLVTATAPKRANQGTQGIGAPSGQDARATGLSFDSYLRRARFMLAGNVTESLSFYFSLDQPHWGRAGSFNGAGSQYSSPLFVQDAFLSYRWASEIGVDAGMMPLPFAHHTLEGAGYLNTLDYHAEMLRLPTGKNFRDTGVQVRGLIAERVHYRLGAFEGVRNAGALETPVQPVGASYPDLNPKGIPRFAGHLRFNVLGKEEGFFFRGVHFSKEPLLSVGVGGDYQPKAVLKLNTLPGTYWAASADAFAEVPVAPTQSLLAKLQFAKYTEGWSRITESTALETGGITAFGEIGYLIGKFEPLVFVEYLRAKSDPTIPITIRPHASLSTHVGLNYFHDQHTFNLKLDMGYRELQQENRGNMVLRQVTYTDLFATVQGQVLF